MARETTTKAKGASLLKIGPTPAPLKPYVTPDLSQTRTFAERGYGTNNDPGASSVPAGAKRTSGLADELKRVSAKGPAGDALQTIIERGARMDTPDFQMRNVSNKGVPIHPGTPGASSGGTIPDKLGAKP